MPLNKLLASIVVMKDGSCRWLVQSPSGLVLGGGGTRTKTPPKDPVKTACRSLERLIKERLAQKR